MFGDSIWPCDVYKDVSCDFNQCEIYSPTPRSGSVAKSPDALTKWKSPEPSTAADPARVWANCSKSVNLAWK